MGTGFGIYTSKYICTCMLTFLLFLLALALFGVCYLSIHFFDKI